MDVSGRLILKDLIVFADIKKQVVLSSVINIIGTDKDRYGAIDDAAVDFEIWLKR